jgi:Flp pilus assembly protein CpaB
MAHLLGPARTWRRARRRLLLHRRLLAALAAGTAVLAGLDAAAPPPRPSVSVWTAGRDLPSGTVLSAGDLVPASYPPSVVPKGAVRDLRAVLGATLAAPLGRGEPLTRLRTVGVGLLRGYPGTTAVPLRITDADVVDLLRVGDDVSFVVADPDGRTPPEDLVDDVPVLALPRPSRSGIATGTPGRLVVVAVPDGRAAEVAARASLGVLIPVWRH